MCKGCPFNFFSEESAHLNNLGCLPDPKDIIETTKLTGKNWACHETNKLCGGMVAYCNRNNIPINIKAGLHFEIGIHSSVNYSLTK
jgi:hypothetical protein